MKLTALLFLLATTLSGMNISNAHIENAIAGEDITAPAFVYVSGGVAALASASTTLFPANAIVFADAVEDGDCQVLYSGVLEWETGLTMGQSGYLSGTTPGGLVTSPADNGQCVGVCVMDGYFMFNPDKSFSSAKPQASTIAKRDANTILFAANFVPGFSTTVTSNGTLTLTAASNKAQYFTGTSPHRCDLPDVTTLTLGQKFEVVNLSTNSVTVRTSGANTVQIVAAGHRSILTYISASGSSTASWDNWYI